MADVTNPDGVAFGPDDLQHFVSDAHALVKLVSRVVTGQVHNLLPSGYRFISATLEQGGCYEVRYEVGFQRRLVLRVPPMGNALGFRASAEDAADPALLGVWGTGESPREALLALARSRPLFAPWRGEADPKAAGGAA